MANVITTPVNKIRTKVVVSFEEIVRAAGCDLGPKGHGWSAALGMDCLVLTHESEGQPSAESAIEVVSLASPKHETPTEALKIATDRATASANVVSGLAGRREGGGPLPDAFDDESDPEGARKRAIDAHESDLAAEQNRQATEPL